jgi:centrosomal protein CEP41
MEKRTGFPTKKLNVTNIQPLDRRVPKNPKYESISPTINSGKTIKQVEILSNQSVARRKGELFRRIKCSTLAKLIEESGTKESVYNIKPPQEEVKETYENKSVTNSIAYSDFSVVTVNTEALGLTENSEFVLLDVREEDEYEKYHIKEAISFPAPNILRDRILPQVFRLKNVKGKFIILYAVEERSGVDAARKFAERDYENVYLLSGGLEKFSLSFPHLITGTLPPSPSRRFTLSSISKPL